MFRFKVVTHEFEGSSADFEKIRHLFEASSASTEPLPVPAAEPSSPIFADAKTSSSKKASAIVAKADGDEPSKEQVVSFFDTSKPIAGTLMDVIRVVREAGDEGTTIEEVAKKLDRPVGAVKAHVRLIGKRTAHVEGWPVSVEGRYEFFDRRWEGRANRYRLRDVVKTLADKGAIKI